MNFFRPTELIIDREALRSNLRSLMKKNRTKFFCPMIKADGYGHGALEVGKIAVAEGCRFLGVALYEEGISLRQAGLIGPDILVFAPLSEDSLKACLQWNLTPVLCAQGDLEILKQKGKDQQLKAHVKVNVGMNRLGFPLKDLDAVEAELRKISGLDLEGICCHLPVANDIPSETSRTLKQLQDFLEHCTHRNFNYKHAFNSEALLQLDHMDHPFMNHLGSRPGIAIYGIGGQDLRPAMKLVSKVVHIQNLSVGDGVSYGSRWQAQRNSVIGVVPVGYADGIRRGLSQNLSVHTRGKVIQVVGTICMDYIMLDLTELASDAAEVSSLEVTILDPDYEGLRVVDWSDRLNTIPYEIMVGFGARIRKVYR